MPERLWRVSDLSLEWRAFRIRPPMAPVRLEELLSRVGGRRRGLETRRHLPRGVGGWLLRAKEEGCDAEEPSCADRTAIVSTCAAVVVVVGSQAVLQEADSRIGMGGRLRRVLVPSPSSVQNFLELRDGEVRRISLLRASVNRSREFRLDQSPPTVPGPGKSPGVPCASLPYRPRHSAPS